MDYHRQRAQWPIMGNKDLLSNLKPLSSPQYFRIGNGELMQATHSGRLGQWDGILYSEECKFNLTVHWLDKVMYEDGECTIYHGKGQLRKKLASGICQIRTDELIALPCRHFPVNAECPDCVGQQARRSQSMPEYCRATGFLKECTWTGSDRPLAAWTDLRVLS